MVISLNYMADALLYFHNYKDESNSFAQLLSKRTRREMHSTDFSIKSAIVPWVHGSSCMLSPYQSDRVKYHCPVTLDKGSHYSTSICTIREERDRVLYIHIILQSRSSSKLDGQSVPPISLLHLVLPPLTRCLIFTSTRTSVIGQFEADNVRHQDNELTRIDTSVHP